MKEKTPKVLTNLKKVLLSLAICISMMAALPLAECQAAVAAPTCVKTQKVNCIVVQDDGKSIVMYPNNPSSYIFIKNLASKAVITNVKSSNKYVKAEAINNRKSNAMDAVQLSFKSNAPRSALNSTSKITFTVKQNGKSYKLACTVTFRKQPTPLKSLKLGSKEIGPKLAGVENFSKVKVTGSKMKVTFKAASGYKIESISAFYENGGAVHANNVKNGASIPTKNLYGISVSYVSSKPANYKAPKKWSGRVKSPLHGSIFIPIYK